MTLGPASPAAGAPPGALGIDDDLESALLAGLADGPDAAPEEADGPIPEAESDPPGPAGRHRRRPGRPVRHPHRRGPQRAPLRRTAGRSPKWRSGRETGSISRAPAPEAPLNGALALSPVLDAAAPGGAFPEPPSPSPEERDDDAGGGAGRSEGPFEASPVDATPGEPPPFAFELEPGPAPRSGLALDEEPADPSPVSIAAPDAPPERFGPPGSGNGLPDADGGDGLVEDEIAAFEPDPRAKGSAGYPSADWSAPAVAADPDLERTLRDVLSLVAPPPGGKALACGSEPGPDPEPPSHLGSDRSDHAPPVAFPATLALDPEGAPEPDLDTALPGESLHPPGATAPPPAEPAPSPFAAALEAGVAPPGRRSRRPRGRRGAHGARLRDRSRVGERASRGALRAREPLRLARRSAKRGHDPRGRAIRAAPLRGPRRDRLPGRRHPRAGRGLRGRHGSGRVRLGRHRPVQPGGPPRRG